MFNSVSNFVWSLFGYKDPEPPKLPDQYFGRGSEHDHPQDDTTISKFEIAVADEALEDLKMRLKNTKFVEPLEDVQFQYGFHPTYLKEVVNYWMNNFNWRQQEKELNRFDHFTTQIEGIKIHFIHQKPNVTDQNVRIVPLLLIHGWPGSFVEFTGILPLLTTPRSNSHNFVFEVICPSIPGYGFSEAPHQKEFSMASAARIFNKLMNRLGFEHYYVQGGDWGSGISITIAKIYPNKVAGVHINMVPVGLTNISTILRLVIGYYRPSWILTEEERRNFSVGQHIGTYLQESGYSHIQATKPDTVGAALSDSPAGLAAYILEKFSTWTDRTNREKVDGGLTLKYNLDHLLTNVTVYWFSDAVASSLRFYKELFSGSCQKLKLEQIPITVPSGMAIFPNELFQWPRAFMAIHKFKNLVRYSVMPRGGHFAAMEEPELMADEIFGFVQDVERCNK